MRSFLRAFAKPFRIVLLLLPPLTAAACSDGTGAEPYVGFYDMTQFRGTPLPAGDGTIFIRSGVLELRSGRRFRLDMDADLNGKAEPVLDEGAFSVSGGLITLNTNPFPLTGTIFPDYIRLDDGDDGKPGSIWVNRD